MEMHDRVRLLRKEHLHLSQAELGDKLGVSRSVIKNIELNALQRPEQKLSLIRLMCREFDVNEEWVLNGIEPIFLEPNTFSLDDFAKKNGASELDLKAIRAYFEIDAGVRQSLLEHFIQCFVEPSDISPYDDAPDTPEELERLYPPIEDDDDLEVG